MEKGGPVSITFSSQEELDNAYKEWVDLTESIYGLDRTENQSPKIEPGLGK